MNRQAAQITSQTISPVVPTDTVVTPLRFIPRQRCALDVRAPSWPERDV